MNQQKAIQIELSERQQHILEKMEKGTHTPLHYTNSTQFPDRIKITTYNECVNFFLSEHGV